MPNYTLTSGALFQPFTYDELSKPLERLETLHQEAQEKYATMQETAALYERIANENPDSKAASMYKEYADRLRGAAVDLAMEGYNANTANQVNGLRTLFSTNIVPIKTAFENKQEQIKNWNNLVAKDETMIGARNPINIDLDKFIENPYLNTLDQVYSGKQLTEDVGKSAVRLSQRFQDDKFRIYARKYLAPYQTAYLERYGYSPESILQAAREEDGDNILSLMVDQAIEASGIPDWNFDSEEDRERTLAQAYKRAWMGAWQAIGKDEQKTYTDTYSMNKAIAALQEPPDRPESALVPEYIFSGNDKKLKEKYNTNWSTIERVNKKGTGKENRLALNEMGRSKLASKYSDFYDSFKISAMQKGYTEEEINELIDDLRSVYDITEMRTIASPVHPMTFAIKKNKCSVEEAKKANRAAIKLNNILNDIYNPNDLVGRTRYKYSLTDDMGEKLKKDINTVLKYNKVPMNAVEFDPLGRKYVVSGETAGYLFDNDKIMALRVSPEGLVVTVESKSSTGGEGEIRDFLLPKGINADVEDKITKAMLTLNKSDQKMIEKKKIMDELESSVNDIIKKPENQRTEIENETFQKYLIAYNDYLSAQQLKESALITTEQYLSNLTYENKTKDREFTVNK